jgi:16S rRNA G527 N7-methylase RsmG
VAARAVAQMAVLAELGLPFNSRGGILVAAKSSGAEVSSILPAVLFGHASVTIIQSCYTALRILECVIIEVFFGAKQINLHKHMDLTTKAKCTGGG